MAAPEQHRNNHNSNGNGSGNSNGNGLLSPSHAIPVREMHQQQSSDATDNSLLSTSWTGSLDTGRLGVQRPPSCAAQSFDDGETLRPRSDSFISSADTAVRSRANSDSGPMSAPLADGHHHYRDGHSDHVDGDAHASSNADYDDVPLSEALRPDHRAEMDFRVYDNKFAFSPGQLNKMLNPKSLAAFHALGGLTGLERGLRTDLVCGLSVDEGRLEGSVPFDEVAPSFQSFLLPSSPSPKHEEQRKTPRSIIAKPLVATLASAESKAPGNSQFEDRVRIFKQNRFPARKPTNIFVLFWYAYNDKIIIMLTIAAVVSLSLGIYETVSTGQGVQWIEGVAICVAILIVTIVTAANDWQKEKQFVKLSKRNNDRQVKAVRSGKPLMISIFDLTVGDIVHLEPGDSIPADGVLISGHGVKCDESSATGESDQMKKTNGHEVDQRILDGSATKKLDPFLISGSKVLEGVGTYLVTSVGPYSTYGRILMSLQSTNDPTPLQVKLGGLADWIGYYGSGAAILLFFVLLFRFLAQLSSDSNSPALKAREFVDILIVAITVIVVAIPEGLPLAVTLALAFATARMVKENNLVRVLRACETMGNATVICSDKTGTLTQNKMTVVAGTWASGNGFGQVQSNEEKPSSSPSEACKQFSESARRLICQSIALNSTAFEGETEGRREFLGSKTEVAMLQFAKDYLGMDVAVERASAEIVQLIPFDSSRKCMGVVYREPTVGYRLLVKGAAELMANSCSTKVANEAADYAVVDKFTERDFQDASDVIESYAQRSLRTIGLVYRDFQNWPPSDTQVLEDDPSMARFEDIFRDMTWIGVVGIQDPLRPEVPAAIQMCHNAGVQVKMVTGDNVATATAIASSCGVKTDGLVMEGPKFRQLTDEELNEVIPQLQVLARSSPEDKRILVERLKALGETVAVTGDGTNDGPALKTADVGFSMGISGTEVAKEASSIILLDDNFKSIVTAIAWGRAVNDAVAKFIQFQITVNITAVVITFVSAVSNESNQSVLSAVQLLWLNLIMDTFAALALATDAPTEKILNRKPVPKSASMFTRTMWKMILGQSVYKLAVIFMLYYAGDEILGPILSQDKHEAELNTIIFNTFVWMQIFNQYNNRRLDNKHNIFEGVLRNYWFIGINCIMVAGQIMIIFVGGAAFSVTRLTGLQWVVCLICAGFCIPWAVVLRMIPDKHFGIVFDFVVGSIGFVMKPILRGLAATWRFVSWPFKRLFSPKPRHRETAATETDMPHEEAPGTLPDSKQASFNEKKTGNNENSAPSITITIS